MSKAKRGFINWYQDIYRVKKGYYYAVLSFYDSKNKRHVKYISTGLPEKGNKRKAEAELVKIRNAFGRPQRSVSFVPICCSPIICSAGWRSSKVR